MKFENLKASLTKEIKPAYTIAGEDSFLVYYATDLIEKACNLNFPDFNKVVFSGEGFNAQEIVNACEVLPMSDKYRLIIVKDYLNKKNESEKNIIVKYLKNPTPSTVLIFFAGVSNDFYISFVNNVEYVDCNKLGSETLQKWVIANFKKDDKTISGEALKTLLEFCNFSLTKIDGEVKKLVAFAGNNPIINQSDILQIVTKDSEYIIFELTEALSKKDGTGAYNIINKLLEGKDTPVSIIGIITNHFRRLFYVAVSSFNNSELSRMLNVKEYAIIKAKEQLKLFSKMRLKEIYDLCLAVDFDIKSGKMEGVNALNYLLANILSK